MSSVMAILVGGAASRGKPSVCNPLLVEVLTDLWGTLVGRSTLSHSTQPPYCCQTHPRVKAWHSETLTVTLPYRGRMIVAQNRTNKTTGKGLAEFQGNLRSGVGRIEIALLPSNIILKKRFSRRPSRMTGKASVKLLIGITQRTQNKHFSIDTDTVTYNS